ncbi:MAG: class I SAM-dependent methyltransferase [bacterium]
MQRKQDMSPVGFTALYTSQAWIWGGLPEAELFDSRLARAIFLWISSVYRLARWLRPGMSPILQALLHRHVMIDRLLERADVDQVLELAAGLSPRGANVSARAEVVYTEVDLPQMIAAKRGLLARSARGRRIAARPNLRFVAGDATRMAFETLLDASRRAVVIAEGLHMYLDVESQRRLWANVASALGRGSGGTFVFDHFRRAASTRPDFLSGAVLRAMRGWQARIGFVPDRRTREEVVGELREAGFDEVEVVTSRDVTQAWALPHADADTDVAILVAGIHRRDSP